MTLDYSDDYLVWDNKVAVTVALKRATTTNVSISHALKHAVSRDDSELSGVGMDSQNASWTIPDKLLNPSAEGRVIKRDDTITLTGGGVWTVVSATCSAKRKHWHLVTVPQR